MVDSTASARDPERPPGAGGPPRHPSAALIARGAAASTTDSGPPNPRGQARRAPQKQTASPHPRRDSDNNINLLIRCCSASLLLMQCSPKAAPAPRTPQLPSALPLRRCTFCPTGSALYFCFREDYRPGNLQPRASRKPTRHPGQAPGQGRAGKKGRKSPLATGGHWPAAEAF